MEGKSNSHLGFWQVHVRQSVILCLLLVAMIPKEEVVPEACEHRSLMCACAEVWAKLEQKQTRCKLQSTASLCRKPEATVSWHVSCG